MLLLAL
jgi:symplekin